MCTTVQKSGRAPFNPGTLAPSGVMDVFFGFPVHHHFIPGPMAPHLQAPTSISSFNQNRNGFFI